MSGVNQSDAGLSEKTTANAPSRISCATPRCVGGDSGPASPSHSSAAMHPVEAAKSRHARRIFHLAARVEIWAEAARSIAGSWLLVGLLWWIAPRHSFTAIAILLAASAAAVTTIAATITAVAKDMRHRRRAAAPKSTRRKNR